MEDWLYEVPKAVEEGTAGHDWGSFIREVQEKYLQDLMNQTLPKMFFGHLSVSVDDQSLRKLTKNLEAYFGLSTVVEVASLTDAFYLKALGAGDNGARS